MKTLTYRILTFWGLDIIRTRVISYAFESDNDFIKLEYYYMQKDKQIHKVLYIKKDKFLGFAITDDGENNN